MKIEKSKFGKELLIDGSDYIYKIKYTNKHTIGWVCVVEGCKSYALTALDYTNNLTSFVLKIRHSHPSTTDSVLKRSLVNKMKDKIVSSNDSSRNVVNSTIRGCGVQELRALGNIENLYRLPRNHRQNFINPAPYHNNYLKLSSLLLNTHTKQEFYQYSPI